MVGGSVSLNIWVWSILERHSSSASYYLPAHDTERSGIWNVCHAEDLPYQARRRSPTGRAQLFILAGSPDIRGPPAGGRRPASRDPSRDRRAPARPSHNGPTVTRPSRNGSRAAESAIRLRPRPRPSAPYPLPGRTVRMSNTNSRTTLFTSGSANFQSS
eukprot:365124-Chlamydomonas_euryale.AAC.22